MMLWSFVKDAVNDAVNDAYRLFPGKLPPGGLRVISVEIWGHEQEPEMVAGRVKVILPGRKTAMTFHFGYTFDSKRRPKLFS